MLDDYTYLAISRGRGIESLHRHFFFVDCELVAKGLVEDKHVCSKCKSSHVDVYEMDRKWFIACFDCGFEKEYKLIQ